MSNIIVAVVNHDKLGEEIVGIIKIKVDGKKSDNIIKGLNKLKGVRYIAHYQRRGLQKAVIRLKQTGFVFSVAGVNPAVVHDFGHVG
jgi:hypothetical protein